MLHISFNNLKFSVPLDFSECPLNTHLLVVVEYTVKHLLLALSNLLVSVHGCKCDFEKPFFTDAGFYFKFKRLQMQTLLA